MWERELILKTFSVEKEEVFVYQYASLVQTMPAKSKGEVSHLPPDLKVLDHLPNIDFLIPMYCDVRGKLDSS